MSVLRQQQRRTSGAYAVALPGPIFSAGALSTPTPPPPVTQTETPVISPLAGEYIGAPTVSITCATGGATIHFTTDGSTPTSSSPVYSGPFSVTTTTTVQAYATSSGNLDSSVASSVYTVQAFTSPDATVTDKFGIASWGGPSGLTAVTIEVALSLGGYDFEGDTTLVTLNFPNLTAIDPTNTQGGYLLITGCTSMTTLTLPLWLPNPGNTYTLTGNAFSAATVNAFLARCVANAAFTTGTVNLSGGTSAAPTGQGATDKATLIGRGVTVTTN